MHESFSVASMRPRPFGPGYPLRHLQEAAVPRCFNEAQAFRPRIRLDRLQIHAIYDSFNEAQAFRPRIRLWRLCTARYKRCFNEAQAFRPRILPCDAPVHAQASPASMRPRPFGPGYNCTGGQGQQDMQRFNEAQAFRPRIPG